MHGEVAYTVVSANIPSTRSPIELRWSPTCNTNWARMSTGFAVNDFNGLGATQCKTGYTQRGVVNRTADYSWTRMIYSPTLSVRAWWNAAPGAVGTSCA